MIDKSPPEIDASPISGRIARNGIAVDVQIYRAKPLGEDVLSWTLEIVSEEGKSRICGNTLPTDHDASKAFYRSVEKDGISFLLEDGVVAALLDAERKAMAKRKRSPIPPALGVQPDIKPNAWDAKLHQTSDFAMTAIEQERAKIREKTARLRKERLKAKDAKMEKLPAAPTPEEIARVLSRINASRADKKKS
jgi:hypothetical protein